MSNEILFSLAQTLLQEYMGSPNGCLANYEKTEDDTLMTFYVDIPGVLKENITIDMFSGYIVINGTRIAPSPELESNPKYGEFEIPIFFKNHVDMKVPVKASLSNGVLTMICAKECSKIQVLLDGEDTGVRTG